MLMMKHTWVWTCNGCGQEISKTDNQLMGYEPVLFGLPSGWLQVERLGGVSHYCTLDCLQQQLLPDQSR